MSVPHLSRRLAKKAYRMVRVFVRGLFGLVILGMLLFVFLRVYGVPGPLLREIIKRANKVGIPIEVEGITLTLHGWRADHVRYYSTNPDDLEPLFQADRVFFSVRDGNPETVDSEGWNVEVEAEGINMNPSVEWGVEIPMTSASRHIDQLEVALAFTPDRILLSQGKMTWLGSRFNVNGSILKRTDKKPQPSAQRVEGPQQRQKTVSPTRITAKQFQAFEDRIKRITLPAGANIDIGFSVDMANYSSSSLELAVHADGMGMRGVEFTKGEIVLSYAYPTIELKRAGLFRENQSVQLSGEYNLASKEAKGSLCNSILSNHLLLLLPAKVHDFLAKAELRFDYLPCLEIDFGPSLAKELLNQISGVFSIRGLAYRGFEVEALRGSIKRENNRLEFTNLKGSALGQEERAEEMGSAMYGGFAEGTVFWDGNTHEFGVDVDASLDPNLLVRALSPVEIATNIIRRFHFKDQPPRGHVAVGADLDDLNTFYINIQALANDVIIQGVDFSSVNITQTYKHGKLNLDPVAAMQGVGFIKGSALFDFYESTADFDLFSSMDPADLEDLIFPEIQLFGNTITAGGKINITTDGIFDWGSMKQTDFSAMVEAERLGLSVAALDHFTAEIGGKGPVVSVKNATFSLYGGEGEGEFSIAWNPSLEPLPYEAEFSFSNSDFRQFLLFFSRDRPVTVSGRMTGNVHVEADLSTNFFSVATGAGFVRVEKGQLADLPLFNGFSRLMRKVFPSFTVFSITSLRGNFTIEGGEVLSEDAYFEGNVLSAKGRGSYSPVRGFDAHIQTQVFSEGTISKVVRAITDPLMKLLEIKLEGPLANPSWNLEKF